MFVAGTVASILYLILTGLVLVGLEVPPASLIRVAPAVLLGGAAAFMAGVVFFVLLPHAAVGLFEKFFTASKSEQRIYVLVLVFVIGCAGVTWFLYSALSAS